MSHLKVSEILTSTSTGFTRVGIADLKRLIETMSMYKKKASRAV